jgi:hypothetical protein
MEAADTAPGAEVAAPASSRPLLPVRPVVLAAALAAAIATAGIATIGSPQEPPWLSGRSTR